MVPNQTESGLCLIGEGGVRGMDYNVDCESEDGSYIYYLT